MAEDQTWEQRTAERLQAEMDSNKAPSGPVAVEEETSQEIPLETAESEDEVDGALSDSDTDEEGATDLETETPDDDNAEVITDWESRYKEVQAELGRATDHKAERDAEVAEMTEEYTRGRFEFEDATAQAKQAYDYVMQAATQKANQARQINFAQVPPDQVAQAQQWVQQAMAEEQQVKTAYDQFTQHITAEKDKQLQREVVVARKSLQRQIPDFDTNYPEIMKHMVELGMSQREASETINPATIRAYYNSMQLSKAPATVEIEKQPKARLPKSRIAQSQSRGLDGKFKKADEAFRSTTDPSKRRDAWEARTRLRLEKESRR